MDSWPTNTQARSTNQKRRGKQKKNTEGLPLHFEAGAVTAATLQQNNGRLVWTSVSKNIKGRKLIPRGNGVNAFPVTRSPSLPNSPITKYQLYEQGVQFLRTCHPDVDIPSDLIRDEIVADTQESARLKAFDPFLTNNIESAHWAFGHEKSSFLAFPMGETTSELNISPIRFSKEGNVVFKPFAYPIESFQTPIRQIVSSPSEDLRNPLLAVRTFTSTYLYSLEQVINESHSPVPQITELARFKRTELGDRQAADVVLSSPYKTAVLVNDLGAMCRYRIDDVPKLDMIRQGNDPASENDFFWRLALGDDANTCFFSSSTALRKTDFRARDADLSMFSTIFPKDLITSIERVQRDGLMRICTTREILCLDERYPGKPVLAFKHSRQFDRSLQARTLELRPALLTILTSRQNGLMTVYDASRETSGLTHAYASPYSLQMPMGHMEQHAGYAFVQPPDGSEQEIMSMFQLSGHGSVHQLGFLFSADDSSPKDAMDDFAVIEWSEEVEELDAKVKLMRTETGPLGSRNVKDIDLRPAYKKLFGCQHAGGGIFPEISAEAFYETLDKMPTFWQNSDEPIEHMLTTFDIAFRSGNEPSDPGRADFLTQSALSTTRGYRAFVQDRIPLMKLAQQVPWHRDITPFLQRFVPEMEEISHRTDDSLRGYDLAPSDERPGLSLRRESESREQLALDLALSTDVFSVQPFSKQHALDPLDEAIETMSRATEAISLTDTTDLPQVHFGYLNPVLQANHYTRLDDGPEEPSKGARAPLGVRLLLKEWDVGTDPDAYVYHDPYGTEILDGGDIRRAAPVLLPPIPRQQSQSQRPPMVVPTIAAGPPIVSRIATDNLTRQGVFAHSQGANPALRNVMQESQESGFGGSQEFVTNTQIVPGPFGGRQTAGKKKVGKKRIGGF